MGHIPFFAENPLDRMDHVRDTIRIEDIHSEVRFILFSDGQVILRVSDQQFVFSQEDLDAIEHVQKLSIFLGREDETYYFAMDVGMDAGEEFEALDIRAFVLRRIMPVSDLGMIAQAGGVLKWHDNHRFCSNCGRETAISHSGWRRNCGHCEKQHFPRLDPVIIMLVTHGDNCLIGANYTYPENFYSCLAGFIEPGETIEDAARRELQEEVGVKGGDVRYICSQPWPFPHSLMIGVHVEAETTELTIDDHELRDAKWISKDEVRAVLDDPEGYGYYLPPSLAIARTLFKGWIE